MKKRFLKNLVVLLTVTSLSACSNGGSVKQLRNPEGLNHSYQYEDYSSAGFKIFKDKMQVFANKLSHAITNHYFKEGENLIISPLSIELCLGLAVRSTNGQTRRELLEAFDINYDSFNQYYKLWFNTINNKAYTNTKDLASELSLINSIWIDNDVSLLGNCLDALRDDYYCYSYHVDFDGDNKTANEKIKDFIKQKSHGLLNPDLGISPETLFVLMNTIYLKDIWNDVGSDLKYASSDFNFKNINGSYSSKKLLQGYYNDGKAIETDDYSAFFTETSHYYRLFFIKPHENKELKNIFNKATMDYVLDSSHYVEVDEEKLEKYHTRCLFPEFNVESRLDLKNLLLEDFNVETLFDQRCDFSNITNTNSPVFCTDLQQVAKLKVDKKGIEGAAVTYLVAGGAAGPGPYTDIYENFVVDKEFGYILTAGDNVVFSGVVTNID